MIRRRASAGRVGRLAESVVASGYASIVVDRLARQACELVDADVSCLVVRDRARPEAAIAGALPDRGRGLALMAGLVDELELRPGREGTAVRLSKRRSESSARRP